MKKRIMKLYDIITLKIENRQLKKQIKEMIKQNNVMIKNAKEREANLKFSNERANRFQQQLRKLRKELNEYKNKEKSIKIKK